MMTTSSVPTVDQPTGHCGSPGFFLAKEYAEALARLGLTSLDAVFAFDSGSDLAKPNIGRFRRRRQFEVPRAERRKPVQVFLKCYDHPPMRQQLRNWLAHGRCRSFASMEREIIERLAARGINVPHVVAWGQQWGRVFERRSFLMTEEIRDAQSLERRLPSCFHAAPTPVVLRARREFLRRLARFIRRFHETGHCHRDLYLSHIFYSEAGEFYLIDLARAWRPVLRRRFQMKDIAQLYYSSPGWSVSETDRLRFFLTYVDRRRLTTRDKAFLRRVIHKVHQMARHNRKRGGPVPFAVQDPPDEHA